MIIKILKSLRTFILRVIYSKAVQFIITKIGITFIGYPICKLLEAFDNNTDIKIRWLIAFLGIILIEIIYEITYSIFHRRTMKKLRVVVNQMAIMLKHNDFYGCKKSIEELFPAETSDPLVKDVILICQTLQSKEATIESEKFTVEIEKSILDEEKNI